MLSLLEGISHFLDRLEPTPWNVSYSLYLLFSCTLCMPRRASQYGPNAEELATLGTLTVTLVSSAKSTTLITRNAYRRRHRSANYGSSVTD